MFPLFYLYYIQIIAPSIFPEKDLSRIFRDVKGYGYVFLDRIRERNWYELVYNNSNEDVFYCPNIVNKFYSGIDTNTIGLDQIQFLVHLEHGDLLVTPATIEKVTQIHVSPVHAAPLLLIDYMTLMGV